MATVTMVPLADLTTCPSCIGFHTLRIPDHWNVMDAYGNPIGTGVPLEIYIGGPYPECSTDEDCDDGNLCTTGTCDEMNCFFEPVWCPEGEVCDPETGECVSEYTAPVLIEASSVMTHGAAGDFAINLNLASPWSIESRRESQITQHRFKFVFDQPIDISNAVVTLSHGSHNGTLTLEGDNVLVATMATSPNPAPLNNVCLTINISGVKDVSGQYEMAPAVIRARLILGDVNFSGVANILDLSAVKTQIFISPSAANFIFDVDASGSIAILDMNAVKSNLFGTATCP
ncbi:MAG: hypothetical protein GXY44_04050 [Phycisphaerales bacterium]|nr:hypothetical protein [Phycisphaerales bacterium]